MSGEETIDLVVLGGGSAGVRCARVAASLGARVALVEQGALGGTCVNLGCIPKKLLAYGAHAAHDVEEARAMGWTLGEPRADWTTLVAKKDAEITRLNGVYERLLVEAGVSIVRGHGAIERVGERLAVRVGERAIATRHVVIATGGMPRRPAIPGAELGDVSDDFFHWKTLPRSIVIVGAGYVALEIGSVLAALGVSVDIVARAHVLGAFDADVGRFLRDELRSEGLRIRETCGDVLSVARTNDGVVVATDSGGSHRAERVLFAIGRDPHVAGLAALGVRIDRGAVVVDDRFETDVKGIYAIGDVLARTELTPVALAEGTFVAHTIFGGGAHLSYENVPTAVFSMPPVASVGLSEAQARERGLSPRVFRTVFTPLKHRLTGLPRKTMMKMIVDGASDRVLGIHIVGEDAPEMIQGFAVALVAGVTKAQVDATIGVHPTAAEELVTMRTPVST